MTLVHRVLDEKPILTFEASGAPIIDGCGGGALHCCCVGVVVKSAGRVGPTTH